MFCQRTKDSAGKTSPVHALFLSFSTYQWYALQSGAINDPLTLLEICSPCTGMALQPAHTQTHAHTNSCRDSMVFKNTGAGAKRKKIIPSFPACEAATGNKRKKMDLNIVQGVFQFLLTTTSTRRSTQPASKHTSLWSANCQPAPPNHPIKVNRPLTFCPSKHWKWTIIWWCILFWDVFQPTFWFPTLLHTQAGRGECLQNWIFHLNMKHQHKTNFNMLYRVAKQMLDYKKNLTPNGLAAIADHL